VWFGME